MNIVTAIFVIQYFAVPGHENGDGIREKKHPRGNSARNAIQALMAYTRIFQFDRVHQVVQGNVRVTSTQTGEHGRHKTTKGDEWISAESAEQQIEPHDVGLQTLDGADQAKNSSRIIERPTPQNGKPLRFLVISRELIREYRKVKKRVALQFLSDVKPVFT